MDIKSFENSIFIKSENEMFEFARDFAKKLSGNETILLFGNLGSGKTFFSKIIISTLISHKNPNDITSPTFCIMNQYFDDKIIINHYDLYRIKNKEECYEIGIFDNLNKSINLIEWPEIVENEIKKLSINIIKIQIKVDKNNNRLITF